VLGLGFALTPFNARAGGCSAPEVRDPNDGRVSFLGRRVSFPGWWCRSSTGSFSHQIDQRNRTWARAFSGELACAALKTQPREVCYKAPGERAFIGA
jgi:hypothetical protein